jgi:MFS family permease
MHFSVLTTTVIYATYAGGVLFTLLVFGRWSDAIGRRPVLLAGVVCALVSDVIFLFAGSVPILLVARVVSGFSAGVFAGTATAAVIEAAPQAWRTRAASVATVANIGALGIGPLLSGLLVEYAAEPLRLSFIVHIVLAVLAAAAVAYAPETSPRTGRLTVQRVSVPAEIRPMFAIAALAAFAGFAVTGLFTAVVPSFLADVVGIDNHAVAGLVVCSIFAVSAVAQVASTNVSPRRAVALGCAILVAGMVILAVALHLSSLTGVVTSAVISGIGQGMSFSRGLAAVMDGAPDDRRAEISSTYFVVAYVAISLPVIGEGLATQAWGLRTAGLTFAVAVAILASVCLTAILVREARESRRNTV